MPVCSVNMAKVGNALVSGINKKKAVYTPWVNTMSAAFTSHRVKEEVRERASAFWLLAILVSLAFTSKKQLHVHPFGFENLGGGNFNFYFTIRLFAFFFCSSFPQSHWWPVVLILWAALYVVVTEYCFIDIRI